MDTATTVFLLLQASLFVLLCLVRSLSLIPLLVTDFELNRKARQKDAEASQLLTKQYMLQDIITLRYVVEVLLSVLLVVSSIAALGWLIGSAASVVLIVGSSLAARLGVIVRIAHSLYDPYEPKLIQMLKKIQPALRFLRVPPVYPTQDFVISSKQELLHLVAQATGVLSDQEIRLLTHSLHFREKLVKDIMAPRAVIDSVEQKELLGPLVLDSLHKTGHSRIPVINKDIDHVVGVLHIKQLLNIESKQSVTAQKAMEKKVFYILETHNLQEALTAFLRVKHQLFIVVNEVRETVGVVSLEDVIEALIGDKIQDEFDKDDDIQAVIARKARTNNDSENGVDV